MSEFYSVCVAFLIEQAQAFAVDLSIAWHCCVLLDSVGRQPDYLCAPASYYPEQWGFAGNSLFLPARPAVRWQKLRT